MSIRRTALDVLTRPRLHDIARRTGIEISSSASRAEMLDRISRSHSVPFKKLVEEFFRVELKLVCQRLKLEDGGREGQLLVMRIVTAERLSRDKSVRANAFITKANVGTSTGSRSRGTSNFLNGVTQMEEPKVVPSPSSILEPDATQPEQDRDGVALSWGGKRTEVDRIVLPFQRIEVVNESRATREAEKGTFFRDLKPETTVDSPEWRNKLIWGDNKYVLGSLLEQYAGKVDLIYIDPPFGTGQNFSFTVDVGDDEFTKDPSLIEEKAYRDTWGRGVDSYLSMMYERLHLLRQLLSEKGSIFVHLDVHMGPYIKVLMDEVFGKRNFQNEIAWYYYNKMHDSRKRLLPKAFDPILYYVKNKSANTYHYTALTEKRDKPVTQLKRVKVAGKMINARDEDGNIIYQEKDTRTVDTVWRIRCLQPANKQEWVNYDTQKPVDLIERILEIASSPGDLVLDAFVGSGTAAIAAERQKRRWIAVDLSRYSIHVTRKRLLNEDGCRPFDVLNLGKYERQYWQGITFGSGTKGEATAIHNYVKFVLDLYKAEPTAGLSHLHGQRAGRMIHVGAADAPVTLSEIREAVDECRKIKQDKIDVLGWEWEMGLHDVIEAESKRSGTSLRLLQIPREAMDRRAVDAGDVHFYELAYLEIDIEVKGKEARLKLKNFVIPSPELIPDDIRKKIKKWSDFIDYWAVDFEFNDDTFHNQWQDYRTRSSRDLGLMSDWHDYKKTGRYKVLVKVFDIFGNDTTQLLEVRV
jgi:DNA modification methylase